MDERFVKNFVIAFVKTAVWFCGMILFWWFLLNLLDYFLGPKGAFSAFLSIAGIGFCSMLAYLKAKTEG